MPYSYTPSPIYVSPVQLASDGDPASSATIMGPIEQALDNAAAMWEGGARRIRTVADFAALRALTGMAANDIALVADANDPGWESGSYGIYRFVPGGGSEINNIWQQDADDDSGQWVWIDYTRAFGEGGFPTLNVARELLVGSGCTALRIGADSWLESGADLEAREGTTITLAAAADPFTTKGGRLLVSAGQPSPLDQRGGIILQSGGRLFAEAGGFVIIDTGKLIVETGGSATLKGSLQVTGGGFIQLEERIQHEVIRYSDAALNGTPIAITAATADEHLLGSTPAAPTTLALADPSAVGQRVRFSRTSTAHAATHLTVTASGVSYTLSGGGGDLAWLELVSAYDESLNLTWYPSQYAVH